MNPCPKDTIERMVKDGVKGTSSGDGLQQLLANQEGEGFTGVTKYYRAARAYNSGSVVDGTNLAVAASSTPCYASDVANWLTGWNGKNGECNGNALR